jgi:hypothetical protein
MRIWIRLVISSLKFYLNNKALKEILIAILFVTRHVPMILWYTNSQATILTVQILLDIYILLVICYVSFQIKYVFSSIHIQVLATMISKILMFPATECAIWYKIHIVLSLFEMYYGKHIHIMQSFYSLFNLISFCRKSHCPHESNLQLYNTAS